MCYTLPIHKACLRQEPRRWLYFKSLCALYKTIYICNNMVQYEYMLRAEHVSGGFTPGGTVCVSGGTRSGGTVCVSGGARSGGTVCVSGGARSSGTVCVSGGARPNGAVCVSGGLGPAVQYVFQAVLGLAVQYVFQAVLGPAVQYTFQAVLGPAVQYIFRAALGSALHSIVPGGTGCRFRPARRSPGGPADRARPDSMPVCQHHQPIRRESIKRLSGAASVALAGRRRRPGRTFVTLPGRRVNQTPPAATWGRRGGRAVVRQVVKGQTTDVVFMLT